MKLRETGILALVAAIPFLIYGLRPDLIGVDSYHYLMQLEALGGNALIAKLMLFGSLFLTLIGSSLISELYCKGSGNGWKAGILAMLSPALIFEFAKFETEAFAFPLLVWATLFALKGPKKYKVLALLTVGAAGLIWQGSIYYIIAFGSVSALAFLATIPVLILFWQRLIYSITPWLPIGWENRPLIAIKYWWILGLGFLGTKKQYAPILAFLSIMALLNSKYVFHPIPLLAVGMVNFLEHPKMQQFQTFFLVLAVITALGTGIDLLFQPPTQQQLEAIEFAMDSTHPDYEIQNDWELGYWVRWKGGYTQDAAGGPEFIPFQMKGVILTKQTLSCPELKRFDYLTVYDCSSLET